MTYQTNSANATVSVASSNSANAVSSLLDTIITKHNAWTVGTRKASQQELYSVLAECLELMNTVKLNHRYVDLNKKLEGLHVRYTQSTSLPTRIVRAVFKDDGRNLSRYASIIKIAMAKDVKPEEFVAWLIANEGIDAVRQSSRKIKEVIVPNDVLYRKAVDHLLVTPSLATVSKMLLANISQAPTSGYVISIARINPVGDYEVVGASTDSIAVRRALLSWGQHLVDKKLSIEMDDGAKASNQKLAESMAA